MISENDLTYNFPFVDTPPTYDKLGLNALYASDLILTPFAFTQLDF
jgi:cellulose biosynthesis protein BcsQ